MEELSKDSAADAITALQEAPTALKSARAKGLLAPHDTPLLEAIERALHWVSADRSALGDSHAAATRATVDDAWLTVHVVGAIILRLTASGPRSPTV